MLNKPVINESMTVVDVPLTQIYSDSTFNPRGEIRVSDVVELARNIDKSGLLQPITLQPYTKMLPYIYRIVAGHRRHAAFMYLRRVTIPAIVKEGLSEIDALALNFTENVNRKDLNILEEAHGVQRFLDEGETVESLAKLINKGKQWIIIRKELLKMPAPIQEDAAVGWLTQAQILDLTDVHDANDQMAIVKAIKEAKGRNEKRLPKITKKKVKPTVRKRRTPDEIMDMMDHIIDETAVTSPFTRAMAWANGEISDLDLYRDMQEYFDKESVPYSPPLEVLDLMRTIPIPQMNN